MQICWKCHSTDLECLSVPVSTFIFSHQAKGGSWLSVNNCEPDNCQIAFSKRGDPAIKGLKDDYPHNLSVTYCCDCGTIQDFINKS